MAGTARRIVVRWVLTLVLVSVVAPELSRPAQAFEGDHFAWTYYLALQVGYTRRQAYQIASAAYAVDWDSNTGPMEAGLPEVLVGARHPGITYLRSQGPNDKVVGIWRRFHAFANVEHCVLTQEELDWLAWLTNRRELISEGARLPFRGAAPPVSDLEREVFKVLPLCSAADRLRIEDERRQSRGALEALARADRNPGPLIHFVQDTYPHGDYSVVRGHALLGHLPDFLDSDMAKAWAMTEDTLGVLQWFMLDVLGKKPNTLDRDAIRRVLNQLAAANPAPERSTVWFNWSTWDPGASATLTDTIRAVSMTAGSPMMGPSLDVVRRMVDIDERTGRLPPKFPNAPVFNLPGVQEPVLFVDDRIPAEWMPFHFNTDGSVLPSTTINGRAVNPRYHVEQLEISLGTPQAAVRAITRDRARVMFRFPYRVANAAVLGTGNGAYLSPLPVLETLVEAGQVVHHRRLEGRVQGEHVIEASIDRDVTDLERAITWDVTVHPIDLDPVRQQTPVRADVGCAALPGVAPNLNRLRGITNGISATAQHQREVRRRVLADELPAIERDRAAAAAYLGRVEGFFDQTQASCRAASLLVGQVAQVRDQLDAAVGQTTLLRSTALGLAGVTCEVAGRMASAATDAARANVAANAAAFARQTRAKAGELDPVLEQARAAHREIERVIQAAGLRELVAQDGTRQAAAAWFGSAFRILHDRLARAEAAVADLPNVLRDSEALAAAIRTPLSSCFRTTAVRAVEDEVARLSARVHEVISADDLDLGDVPPLADWTRQQIAALEAAAGQSRIQGPACRGAADLMTRLEPKPRELAATVDTIDLFAQNSRDAATKAEACAADAARAGATAAPRPSTPSRAGPVYRIVETRIEPQIIGRPDLVQVKPGLQTTFQLRGAFGANAAAGNLTVSAPPEIRGDETAISVTADATGQWNLAGQVFQWLNVNVNVLGTGENKTTGQEMHPPGSYSASARAAVTASLNQLGPFAKRWEADGRIYRELTVGFGVAFTEYGILIKYIYATDK